MYLVAICPKGNKQTKNLLAILKTTYTDVSVLGGVSIDTYIIIRLISILISCQFKSTARLSSIQFITVKSEDITWIPRSTNICEYIIV